MFLTPDFTFVPTNINFEVDLPTLSSERGSKKIIVWGWE
jgi:hypothetical protein